MSLKRVLGAGVFIALVVVVLLTAPAVRPVRAAGAAPEWAANTTVIEACSCPMFCQCYFNTKPASHSHGMGVADQ